MSNRALSLYFLRHGIAFDSGAWKGSDFDRPLTDDGRDRLSREAKKISDLNLGLDVIITSPLVRARQTAQIVADALKMQNQLIEDEGLGAHFDSKQLARLLHDQGDASAIMLVGHEPNMSQTIGDLVGGTHIVLKKGGLAYVELPDSSSLTGDLVWLLPPKFLR